MNELQIFKNEEFGQVRTIEVDGKPYFMANDVARALGYSDCPKAIRTHCKGVSEIATPTAGGIQNVKYIPEGDIYRLIIKSQLPSAEKFEKWIFDEVIPSIRKHGGYIVGQDHLTDEQLLAKALLVAQSKITERDEIIQDLTVQIDEMKPKAEHYDIAMDSSHLLNITQIAKEFGMTAAQMNMLLHDLGIQYKTNNCWVPTKQFSNKGYMKSCVIYFRGKAIPQYRWTQKGREFVYRIMSKYGYSPVSGIDATSQSA